MKESCPPSQQGSSFRSTSTCEHLTVSERSSRVLSLVLPSSRVMKLLEIMFGMLSKLKSFGWMGQAGYVLGLGVWTLLCLPTTPVELAAGFVFPTVSSTGLSALGKTVGSLAALVLGRRLLKPLIQRWLLSSGPVHRRLIRELRENPILTSAAHRRSSAAPLNGRTEPHHPLRL